MDAEKASFPISFMAERLGVSTSGFYEWRQRQQSPCERRIADAGLAETIVEIWRQSRGTYGSPRIWAELRLGMNIRVSRKRVARLMRQQGIEGVYRRRNRGCTRRNPSAVPDEDLVNRRFSVDGPDRLWIADPYTQHRTREGNVFLAAIVDAWSRRVIGWSIADHLPYRTGR
jgi:putative transposase